MKNIRSIIATVLAVYMLGLLFLPCRDNCESEEHSYVVLLESSQDHHQENNDVCSPFCFCSCCATSIVLQPAMEFDHHAFQSSRGFSQYAISFFTEVHSAVWQPPKLG